MNIEFNKCDINYPDIEVFDVLRLVSGFTLANDV